MTFLLWAVKMSDLSLAGLGRPEVDLVLDEEELEISDARFVEKAREVEEEISLALVFEACLTP